MKATSHFGDRYNDQVVEQHSFHSILGSDCQDQCPFYNQLKH